MFLRNAISTQTYTWEEMQSHFAEIFFGGDELAVSQSTAQRLSPIAAAHRILCNSFGLIPFGVYLKDGDARVPASAPELAAVLKDRPNSMMTPFMAQRLVMSNAFWWGWGAMWNRRGPDGRIAERIPLPTDCCTIRRNQKDGNYWYTYNVDGVTRTFGAGELSFLFFETYDGIHGRGMLELAREVVAADGMAQRHNKKFYQNGARIGGIVEVDTDAKKETRDRIKEEFQAYASGDDAFKVAVLDHGMKYTQLGLSHADAQYVEGRTFTVEEVSRFTGIPKWMLQTGKESYESNQSQRIAFVTDTLMPYVAAWEQEDSYKIISPEQKRQGMYLHGNISVLLRGDDKSRAEFYEIQIRNSVYNPDECRALEERAPIPGGLGQRFLVTKNLGSLESVINGNE